MLYAPTNTVISTQIWNLWQTGQSGVASALGVMLITSLVTVTWLARKIFSWRSVM
jgi:ABC-type Fe3+ transport system permease subunit